jgi:hypothetical protein
MREFCLRISMREKNAEESAKTRKAREKLQKKLAFLDEKITPGALKEQVEEIHAWIAKNAASRISFPEKELALFDENQNTAPVSRKIAYAMDQIQSAIEKESPNLILQRILRVGASALTENTS